MPRMRPAMRSGWNGSSASIFSPVPISTIGLPVIARIDSAAPPRASPSTRVRTMPVTPARSPKAFATLTASWPVIASATSSVWCGVGRLAHRGDFEHQLLVDVQPARRVEHHDVVALAPPDLQRAPGDLDRALARHDRQGRDADLACRAGPAAPAPPDAARRARPSAPSCARGSSAAARSWRRSSSCPSPAARPA